MNKLISIIIPCYNSAQTIGVCLQAIQKSDYPNYEVIVVDDFSTDNTRDIVREYPCQLICLPENRGAGYARNVGAQASHGDLLFFTDSDCVLQENTLSIVASSLSSEDSNVVLGGTYTRQPYDKGFFSHFQSLFINYAETKHSQNPDYIATHALAMHAKLFSQFEGFNNQEYPILEDVEYSHRLRRSGVKLLMNPELQVQHIFNFSFFRSMKNAVPKSSYWTIYNLKNRDLFCDSGTASHELKVNTIAFAVSILLLALIYISDNYLLKTMLFAIVIFNIRLNYHFLASIYRSEKFAFTLTAVSYYLFVYPAAVSVGSMLGISRYLKQRKTNKQQDTIKEFA